MSTARSIFDIIGPVMVGPSSSHTAGAVRLGALARAIFGEQPRSARIGLYGSFADTGEGHGTQVALIAGLLGLKVDDPRIPDSFELAQSAGLDFSFEELSSDDAHPNTARFVLECPEKDKLFTITGSSIGGGSVIVTRIGSFPVEATGDLPLIVARHTDEPGIISAVTAIFAAENINIASMKMSRERRGAEALMIFECDTLPEISIIEKLKTIPQVHKVRVVPAV
ncbi:MAG: L-serine ammonia-lyase, iron-sulfur-dependent subunit beta [Coriobacteriia bacterium]|nr:L-serine ammonia-lyase, iron-sulfur-dependent subunit beta [Coriobacteriia bacterium]